MEVLKTVIELSGIFRSIWLFLLRVFALVRKLYSSKNKTNLLRDKKCNKHTFFWGLYVFETKREKLFDNSEN